ncbi:MAG: hypothetical protein HQK82_15220, partial [Desulfovibrionaceae bacterium]|nr:hypothetical protein [Desulfovibrionaceae bacterium]
MKRAIFVLSQKGGPGKSTFSRALLDVLRSEKGMSVGAFDADGGVGQLLQYYGRRGEDGRLLKEQDPLSGVFPFDIRDNLERDNLINALDLKTQVLLFDFPGGAVDSLQRVLKAENGMEALIQDYRKEGYDITVVIVMSNVHASANNVIKTIKIFGQNVAYVVVKNLFFGEPEDFLFFDGFTDVQGNTVGGRGKAVLTENQGRVIHMPQLRGREYAILDLYSLGFTEALQSANLRRAEKKQHLPLSRRVQKIRLFLRGSFRHHGGSMTLLDKLLQGLPEDVKNNVQRVIINYELDPNNPEIL